MNQRVRFALAATLFVAWIAWLSYAALSKNRGPVVSHAQAAGTTMAVIAELSDGGNGKPAQFVNVVKPLVPGSPQAGRQFVTNLPETRGYTEPGRYLLLLNFDPHAVMVRDEGPELRPYVIVGQQRSPGFGLDDVGPPMIYPDTPAVRKQVEKLLR